MKNKIKIYVVIVSLYFSLFATGCSVHSAIMAPSPIEYKSIDIGLHRDNVVNILGSPSHVYEQKNTDGGGVDNFTFTSGYPAGYKTRIVLYMAADFFTAFLAEIVLWPLESAMLQGSKVRARVEYDKQYKVKKISVFSVKDKKLLYVNP